MRTWTRVLAAAAPPVAAAGLGGLAARNAQTVYAELDKPAWAPPAQVFGPVWSALYTGIGVTGWRMTRRPDPALWTVHALQLGLNAAWTPLFFGARRRRAALAVNSGLDVAVAAQIVMLLRRGDRLSAALLTPYLAWSGFATALTAAVRDPAASSPRVQGDAAR